jgi:hypothetical protein
MDLYQYLPGDLVRLKFPQLTDKRVVQRYLTSKQILEMETYLVCALCHRTCAGTCQPVPHKRF